MLKRFSNSLWSGLTGARILVAGLLAVSCTALLILVSGIAIPSPAMGQGAAPAAAPAADGVAVTVDDEAISSADFDAYFQRYLREKLYHGGSPEQVSELRAKALDELIVERLVAHEVERRHIAGDSEAAERQIAALKERYGASDRWAQVEGALPALREHLLEKSKADVLKAQVEEVVEPDAADLTRFYEENQALFTEPAARRVAVVLIGVPPSAGTQEWRVAEAKGKDLHAQILAGADFDALAKAHSTHESAASGGDLGMIHGGQLSTDVEAALAGISLGEVTPPVRVLEGYVLFKLLGTRPATLQPFDAAREKARGLYLRERKKQQWDQFIEGLRMNAQITVYEQGDAPDQAGANPPK